MTENSKTIAYSIGEPAGIGADILLQLAQTTVLDNLLCIGSAELLSSRAGQLGLAVELLSEADQVKKPGQVAVHDIPIAAPTVCGTANVANVPGVLAALDQAIDGCLDGAYAAMLTGPLHKGVINEAGIEFSGHTEYLAARTNTPLPVMMLATQSMRVALVTTHLPLKAVSQAITEDRVKAVCRIVDHDLRNRFGIDKPRLLVSGLNPHAGECGHLGREELDTIIPALDALRDEGLTIQGPLPADTLFTPKFLTEADVAVAMYHDQGLPVLKFQGFGNAANITLGLPIIRTSVDHGTAFDLAGTGQADTGSLATALALARRLASKNSASIREDKSGEST